MKLSEWAKAIKERDGYTCQECGATAAEIGTRYIHAHHIKPRALGGKNTLENGVTLCKTHHRATHTGEFSARGMAPKRGRQTVVNGISAPSSWWREVEAKAAEKQLPVSKFIQFAVNKYFVKLGRIKSNRYLDNF